MLLYLFLEQKSCKSKKVAWTKKLHEQKSCTWDGDGCVTDRIYLFYIIKRQKMIDGDVIYVSVCQ